MIFDIQIKIKEKWTLYQYSWKVILKKKVNLTKKAIYFLIKITFQAHNYFLWITPFILKFAVSKICESKWKIQVHSPNYLNWNNSCCHAFHLYLLFQILYDLMTYRFCVLQSFCKRNTYNMQCIQACID